MKKLVACIIFALLSATHLAAHPHVFAKASVSFDFFGKQCEGFWVEWEFDQMFSMSMLQPVDANGNGKLDKAEIPALHDYGFRNLVNYGYFIYIRVGEERFQPRKIEGFTAWTEGNTLTYRFFVPLKDRNIEDDIHVAAFDSTFYTSIEYAEEGIDSNQKMGDAPWPQHERRVNKDYPVYYNPRGTANDFTTYTKMAPGLEVAWPEEIHVFFVP